MSQKWRQCLLCSNISPFILSKDQELKPAEPQGIKSHRFCAIKLSLKLICILMAQYSILIDAILVNKV